MVTDHRAHAYPWLRDCNSCTCVQISWFKLSVQKLSAMSGIIDGVVSKSILKKADIRAANMDWFCILPEKRIVDDSIFSWVAGFEEAVSTEFFDYEKALAPANRFEDVTTSDQFSHFLRGLHSS